MTKHRAHIRVTDAEVSQMREQRAAGMRVHEIARFHNRDAAFTSRILTGRYHGFGPGPIASAARFKLTPAERREILQHLSIDRFYLGRDTSVAALSRKYNIDQSTLKIRLIDQAIAWLDRFWSLVDRTGGPESCWPWMGGLLMRQNLPREQWPGRYMDLGGGKHRRPYRPPRLSYELTLGAIPEGHTLRHVAPSDGRSAPHLCCNPLHLSPAKPSGRKRSTPHAETN